MTLYMKIVQFFVPRLSFFKHYGHKLHVFVVRPIRYIHVFHGPFVVKKKRHFRRVSGIIFAPYSRKVSCIT